MEQLMHIGAIDRWKWRKIKKLWSIVEGTKEQISKRWPEHLKKNGFETAFMWGFGLV